jgi:hypothetical protein
MPSIAFPKQLSFDSPHLCECGCGKPTTLAPQTQRSRGWVKGQPTRFAQGHNLRCQSRWENFAVRFWQLVEVMPGANGCWLWRGYINDSGYGEIRIGGKLYRTHRVTYEMTHGLIRGKLFVCHNCPGGDNPACCNPEHLFLGTQLDNMSDAASKGRFCNQARGERARTAKLTASQVLEIRARAATTGVQLIELAAEFGVSPTNIGSIVHRRTWQHV